MLEYLRTRIIQLGIQVGQNDLLKRRIMLTNALNLTIQVFCIILMGFTVYYNLWLEFVVGIVGLSGTFIVYALNSRGKNQVAVLILINVTSISIFSAAIIAYEYSMLAEPENWLFAFVTVAVFLLDGFLLIGQFVVIFLEILIAKLYKYWQFENEYGRDFVLLIVNTAVHCLGLYIFLIFIKMDHFRTQHKLEESNKTKKKLLSILAHDIRSPLGNLKALMTLNEQGVLKNHDFDKHKGAVNSKIDLLMNEIDDVLEWSVVQSENLDPKISVFSARDCIRKVMSMFHDMCMQKSIDVQLSGDIGTISMDENHFKLIIRNLLHNAIKFTPEHGQIVISMQNFDGLSVIEIKDTGIGMKQTVLDELIAPGKTTSIRGTNGEKGTGLGLTMSIDLLKRNKGKLDIESKLNDGSTFRIKIPQKSDVVLDA